MTKRRCLAGCLLVLFLFLPVTAHADIGPKPSVQVECTKMPESVYYVTLLSPQESTGPYSWSPKLDRPAEWLAAPGDEQALQAWNALRSYPDPDGYHFLEYFEKCGPEHSFSWSYRPPQTFKVLVWLPQSDRFLLSESTEQYAFDSYFTATCKEGQTQLRLRKSYQYGPELLSLAARIAATILLELLIALLFRLRGRAFRCVVWTNLVTQILLNVALNLLNYRHELWAFLLNYLWMEVAVLLIEALIYRICFKRCGEQRPYLWLTYAAVANGLSFAAGLALARVIPGIF